MKRQTETRFLVNLGNMTASDVFRRKLRPPGYLAPPKYLTESLSRAARRFSRRGESIVADNGLYDDITRLASQFKGRRLSQALAMEAANAAMTVDATAYYARQVELEPSAIVGLEDITPALWLKIGLTERHLPHQRADLRRRNRRTALLGADVIRKAAGPWDYLPVASAQDYDSAFDAGTEFAAAGLTAAAMGFGAFMNAASFTRIVKMRGRDHTLPMTMPVKYLGTALIARGFWDGWHAEANQAPERFHFLGLGAPIMMGIVSCAAARTPVLTFDATSPITDARQGMIYVSKPAYLKIRAWNAAKRLAADPRERWRCPCGFCRSFVRRHAFDYELGHRWYATHPGPIQPSALKGRATLAHAYPLLAQPTASDLGREINFSRVGHNHWALNDVTVQIQQARQSDRLEAHMGEVVAAYGAATPLRHYAAAVSLAFQIASGTWPS